MYLNISEIRLTNARKLQEESGLDRKAFAVKTGIKYSLLGQYIGENPSKNIGEKIARTLEEKCGKPTNWLDYDHSSNAINDVSKPKDTDISEVDNTIPVISWVAAGSFVEVTNPATIDDVIEWIPKPINSTDKMFGLIVRGQSMYPEFKKGEIIYVNPNVTPMDLNDGDLIVIQYSEGGEATFKQLIIGDTSTDMYLKPLNPDWHEQKIIPLSECKLVGKVVGKHVTY